jgi:hypothetical protein
MLEPELWPAEKRRDWDYELLRLAFLLKSSFLAKSRGSPSIMSLHNVEN